MGYYLPIRDEPSEQYRRNLRNDDSSSYTIERTYRIVLKGIERDRKQPYALRTELARKKSKNTREKRKRFSLEKGMIEGKGEQINVQA